MMQFESSSDILKHDIGVSTEICNASLLYLKNV